MAKEWQTNTQGISMNMKPSARNFNEALQMTRRLCKSLVRITNRQSALRMQMNLLESSTINTQRPISLSTHLHMSHPNFPPKESFKYSFHPKKNPPPPHPNYFQQSLKSFSNNGESYLTSWEEPVDAAIMTPATPGRKKKRGGGGGVNNKITNIEKEEEEEREEEEKRKKKKKKKKEKKKEEKKRKTEEEEKKRKKKRKEKKKKEGE